ncbi:MAG TPA: ATPase domain-containing protein, partial [Candidatus Dormibacteraeota bacterium]|nr:ATPase domain-containing protein [Candidatus Dormibacteraeota bacterium]
SLVVVAGAPGTGKTILAQQMCFTNGTTEHKAIYYSTISEPPERLLQHVAGFEFFDNAALVTKVEFINLGDMLQASPDGLSLMVDEIIRKCLDEHPSLIVVDSAKALRDYSESHRSLRTAVYRLASGIAHTDTTLIFVGEYTPEEIGSASEFSLADGILELAYVSHEPMDKRWLRVRKMRSSSHLPGHHPLQISSAGIHLFVRAESVDGHIQAAGETTGRLSTGVKGLDDITHGGLPRGSSTLVLGPSGCGKTALALRFIVEGLENGERCLYVTFQENARQLTAKAASFGWDLTTYMKDGRLRIFNVDESSLDLDFIAAGVRTEVAKGSLSRMVIDSLAEMVLASRESERFPAYARSLLGSLRAAGVSVLTTSETSSLGPTTDVVGGLSFLYHNVVLLRYIENHSVVGRAVAIYKMRDSNHDKGLWAFKIGEQGFEVEDKVEGVTGLLGWSALRNQSGS